MMTVDGEKVWVPGCRRDLVAGLKRMGILKVAGVPLERVSRQALTSAYCRERSHIVRRQHRERAAQRVLRCEVPGLEEAIQLKLFP